MITKREAWEATKPFSKKSKKKKSGCEKKVLEFQKNGLHAERKKEIEESRKARKARKTLGSLLTMLRCCSDYFCILVNLSIQFKNYSIVNV